MIAALYVLNRGPYFGLPDVDPWPESRDARSYDGPHPVVAHPPCERWGRYAAGGPSHHGRFTPGGDGGCFESALAAVRRCGGVLEHPDGSRAWKHFGLTTPTRGAGWIPAGDGIGWTCAVAQGNYGHAAEKWTWLYAVGLRSRPELDWSDPPKPTRRPLIERARTRGVIELMSRRQRCATPPAFRDLLIGMARSAGPNEGIDSSA